MSALPHKLAMVVSYTSIIEILYVSKYQTLAPLSATFAEARF
jgi:hypothetical protein